MMDINLPDFARLRKLSGFTLREVEGKTDISNAYLSQLENGKIKSPSFAIVVKLFNFYQANKKSVKNEWDELMGKIQESMNEWDEQKRIKVAQALKDMAELILD